MNNNHNLTNAHNDNQRDTAPHTLRQFITLTCLVLGLMAAIWLISIIIPDSRAIEQPDAQNGTVYAQPAADNPCGEPVVRASLTVYGNRTDGAEWQGRPVTVSGATNKTPASAVIDVSLIAPSPQSAQPVSDTAVSLTSNSTVNPTDEDEARLTALNTPNETDASNEQSETEAHNATDQEDQHQTQAVNVETENVETESAEQTTDAETENSEPTEETTLENIEPREDTDQNTLPEQDETATMESDNIPPNQTTTTNTQDTPPAQDMPTSTESQENSGPTNTQPSENATPPAPTCPTPSGIPVHLTGPAPTDLTGTPIGKTIDTTITTDSTGHATFTITAEGLYDPNQLTLTINERQTTLSTATDTDPIDETPLLVLDNGKTPHRGINLTYRADNATLTGTGDTITTNATNVYLRATITDRWFPLHQQVFGTTPLATGTADNTPEQWAESLFHPEENTTAQWTLAAPLTPDSERTSEGIYTAQATYRGFLAPTTPKATYTTPDLPALIVDRTPPTWRNAALDKPATRIGTRIITQPDTTLTLTTLTDTMTSVDKTSITINSDSTTTLHPILTNDTIVIPLGADGTRHDLTSITLTACDTVGNCATQPLSDLTILTLGTVEEIVIDGSQPLITLDYEGCTEPRDGFCQTGRTAVINLRDTTLDIITTEDPDRVIAQADRHEKALADGADSTGGTGGERIVETLLVRARDLIPACPDPAFGPSPCPGAYVARIPMRDDGEWTISAMLDDGMNGSASVEDSFILDGTVPELTVTGVEEGRAYTGDVAPVIRASDLYMNGPVEWSLATKSGAVTAQGRNETDASGYAEIVLNDIPHDRVHDDVYVLDAHCTDHAGNMARLSVSFSVNRFGSTYAFSTRTADINGSYVSQCGGVTIDEINVSGTAADSTITVSHDWDVTTLNAEPYAQSVTDEAGWSRTTYNLPASLFAQDGYYRVQISSQDAAGNYSSTQMDDVLTGGGSATLAFAVDSTAPSPYISGISSGNTYAREQSAGIIHLRDNMEVASTRLVIDGQTVSEWSDEDGEEQIVQIPDDGAMHDISLMVTDRAGNTGTAGIYGVRVANTTADKGTNPVAPLFQATDKSDWDSRGTRTLPLPVILGAGVALLSAVFLLVRWCVLWWRRRRRH